MKKLATFAMLGLAAAISMSTSAAFAKSNEIAVIV